MAEAGRCYFACANSINAGQTQLINQPSQSVKQLCYSERRQVKNQVCAYLSLRHISPPAILRAQRENRLSLVSPRKRHSAHALLLTSHWFSPFLGGFNLFRKLEPWACSEAKLLGQHGGISLKHVLLKTCTNTNLCINNKCIYYPSLSCSVTVSHGGQVTALIQGLVHLLKGTFCLSDHVDFWEYWWV